MAGIHTHHRRFSYRQELGNRTMMNMMMNTMMNNDKKRSDNHALHHGEESSGKYRLDLRRNSDPPLYKAVVARG